MDSDLLAALRGLKHEIEMIKCDAEHEAAHSEDVEDASGADKADEIVGHCQVLLRAIRPPEVEITPQMVEAGAATLADFPPLPDYQLSYVVAEVYRAMEIQRRLSIWGDHCDTSPAKSEPCTDQ